MAETLFDLAPAPVPETLTVDYAGRDSVLTVESINRAGGSILLRSRIDGAPDETKWFSRRGPRLWYWPSEGGHASLVAYQVAEWLEAAWSAGPEPDDAR